MRCTIASSLICVQYYYNSQTQQFMYWDAEKSTYLPAPTAATPDSQAAASATTAPEVAAGEQKKSDDQKKRPPTPEKKVKVAKKIIKVNIDLTNISWSASIDSALDVLQLCAV